MIYKPECVESPRYYINANYLNIIDGTVKSFDDGDTWWYDIMELIGISEFDEVRIYEYLMINELKK